MKTPCLCFLHMHSAAITVFLCLVVPSILFVHLVLAHTSRYIYVYKLPTRLLSARMAVLDRLMHGSENTKGTEMTQ